MKTGIYQIVNSVNQKRYIGYAKNFRTRENRHWETLRKNKHKNIHLQNAYNLYGRYNFYFEVIEECSVEELCLKEHVWCTITKVHNREFGYNIRPTDPTRKAALSEETRAKLKGRKGIPCSTEQKEYYRKLYTGRKLPVETIAKMLIKRKDRIYTPKSEEERQRMSKTRKGRKLSASHNLAKGNAQRRPVIQLTQSGEFVKEWSGVSMTQEAGFQNTGVIKCCKGLRDSHKGYKWKYKN